MNAQSGLALMKNVLQPVKQNSKISDLIGFAPQDLSVPLEISNPCDDFSENDLETIAADLWRAVIEKNTARVRSIIDLWPAKLAFPNRELEGKNIRISELGMRFFQKDIMTMLHERWPLTAKIMFNTALSQDNVEGFEWAVRLEPPKWNQATGLIRINPSHSSIGPSGKKDPSSTPILLGIFTSSPHMFLWGLQQSATEKNREKMLLWFFDHVNPLVKARAAGTLKVLDDISDQEKTPEAGNDSYVCGQVPNTIIRATCALLASAAQSDNPSDGALARWKDWMSSPLAIDTLLNIRGATRPNISSSCFSSLTASFASPTSLVRLAQTASEVPNGEKFLKTLVEDLALSISMGEFEISVLAPSGLGFTEICNSHKTIQNFYAGNWRSVRTAMGETASPTLLDVAFFIHIDLIDSMLQNRAGRAMVLNRMAKPDSFSLCYEFFDRPINKLSAIIDLHKEDWSKWRDSRGNNIAHWMMSITLPKKPSGRARAKGKSVPPSPTVSAINELNRSFPELFVAQNVVGASPLSFVSNEVAFGLEKLILNRSARSTQKDGNCNKASIAIGPRRKL
jgi:hypothetical protein